MIVVAAAASLQIVYHQPPLKRTMKLPALLEMLLAVETRFETKKMRSRDRHWTSVTAIHDPPRLRLNNAMKAIAGPDQSQPAHLDTFSSERGEIHLRIKEKGNAWGERGF